STTGSSSTSAAAASSPRSPASAPATASTVELRNSLQIVDSKTGRPRPVVHGDPGVTARQLWDANPTQNWDVHPCKAKNIYLRTHSKADFLDALKFIAQTPTSSSYGVLQALY